MDRRTFVADSLAATGGISLGSSDAVGTAHIVELREGLRSLYALDDAYGSGDVRPLTVRHLRRIRRVINRGKYPTTIGRQLRLLAGETAEQCAWLYFDADDQDSARRYWGEALATASAVRDSSLEILVFASLSLQASYEGQARDAYDFIRAAHERAVPFGSPVLLSLIALREARALTLLGHKEAAEKQLTTSMRFAERFDRGRPAPDWAAFHGRPELEYAQGNFHMETGHYSAAIPFLKAALTHQDRAYGRNHALYRMTLARGLALAGEVDEGAAEAVANLETMEEVESKRVEQRLVGVRNLLSGIDANPARAAVDELTEYITSRRGNA